MHYFKLKCNATREFLPTLPVKRRIINVRPGKFEGEQDAATEPAPCEDYDVTPAESSTSTFATPASEKFCHNQDNSPTASSEVLSMCKKCQVHIKEKKNLRRKLKRKIRVFEEPKLPSTCKCNMFSILSDFSKLRALVEKQAVEPNC